jgi:meso-butanediol dehydrogenase / (S,S)-butanediol dehydrogenase / diacetyl reductase
MGLHEGRIVLITGTGGGQGRAAALAFAAEGATVVGCDRKPENDETVALVEAVGGVMVGTTPLDLGDSDAVKRWIDDAAERFGRIDVLYNNASAARFAPLGELSDDDWHFTIRNELDIVFYATRHAWRHLAADGGGVVLNTASVSGLVGAPGPMAGHAASKAGVIGFTRQIAVEGAPVGIRAVSISPGPIDTPGPAEHFADPELRAAIAATTLVGRWGRAEEVADLAVFLASDKAAFITATNIVIDGGATAR